ncbi:MAG: hypothetical protein AAFW74_03275 [Pseudomonadota bacterium]
MTGNASSSSGLSIDGQHAGSARQHVARGRVHSFYLQPQYGSVAVILAAGAILVLIGLAFGLHLDAPAQDVSGSTIHYILLAAAALFTWYLLPISIPLISEGIAAGLAWFVFCTDKHPDFVISPRSVFGLSWMSYRRFCWSQIGWIEVRMLKSRGIFSNGKPLSWHLILHSNVPKPNPIIGGLMGNTHEITLGVGFSEADKYAILALIREFAPDKHIQESTRFIGRSF